MTNKIKYPRTKHFDFSPGPHDDDLRLLNTSHFDGRLVVVTEKMDGENTTMYPDAIHARSLDSNHHESRNYVKALHGSIKNEIPDGWRICGENMYAKHSIEYNALSGYFQVFSIWTEENVAVDWDDTKLICGILGLRCVPEIAIGVWDDVKNNLPVIKDDGNVEGYVVRLFDSFHFDNFDKSVAKYVRKNHVQRNEHWMHQKVIPNKLRK